MPFTKGTPVIVGLLLLLLCPACKTKPEIPFKPQAVQSSLPAGPSKMAGLLLNDYLELKDALVATRSEDAHQNAQGMLQQVSTLKAAIMADSMNLHPSGKLLVQLDSMHFQLTRILLQDIKSCEPQRICFKYLSDNVFSFITLIHARQLHLYHQYCPLALNEQGGWWLSTAAEIKNPYFGSKMLTCGELVDTLP
jgi:hypothetical protein